MLRDGVVLEDGEGKVTVNQYSFCELIKHLLVHYAGVVYAEASELVDGSYIADPITDATAACLISHEYPYFWAMNLYYGAMYWERGIPAQPEDMEAYFRFEDEIIRRYNLKEPFEF